MNNATLLGARLSLQQTNPKVCVGDEIPIQHHKPDEIDLFVFSAASWLLHRIHFDEPFATGHDGHQALLVHGPLQGNWMLQVVQSWLGHTARPVSITFRHLAPAFVGESIYCGGTVTAVNPTAGTFEANLWVRKSDDITTTTGTATFLIPEE